MSASLEPSTPTWYLSRKMLRPALLLAQIAGRRRPYQSEFVGHRATGVIFAYLAMDESLLLMRNKVPAERSGAQCAICYWRGNRERPHRQRGW